MPTPRNSTVLEGRLFPGGDATRVVVQDGRVATVSPRDALDEPAGVERWIVPGFFDLQLNGFAGRSFADPALETEHIEHIVQGVLKTGTTRLLPTVVTAELDTLCRQLAVLAEAMEAHPLIRAMCPGVHVEGPFLNPEDGPRGAHRKQFVRPPSIAEFERLQAAARGRILMLTLAPEMPGAIELIRHVAGQGVVVALGHHRADDETIKRAVEAGAVVCTHLGNGSDAMLPRLANYIWRQLGEDRLWACFIADGHHLPPATLRCMLRAKGLARSILVTDAVELTGLPPGRYMRRGLEAELTEDGKVSLVGSPYLAGSVATMPVLLDHAMGDAGLTLVEAVRLATRQPEKLMSRHVSPWSCQPGQSTNLTELAWHRSAGTIAVRAVAMDRFSI